MVVLNPCKSCLEVGHRQWNIFVRVRWQPEFGHWPPLFCCEHSGKCVWRVEAERCMPRFSSKSLETAWRLLCTLLHTCALTGHSVLARAVGVQGSWVQQSQRLANAVFIVLWMTWNPPLDSQPTELWWCERLTLDHAFHCCAWINLALKGLFFLSFKFNMRVYEKEHGSN